MSNNQGLKDLRASFLATREQDRFVSPRDWNMSIYGFEPKNFWYSKTNLPVSPHCEIVRYDFRSRVRFRAELKVPGLQINFIDSYSTTASRLQGVGKIDSIVMITLGGYDWDGISDIGALGIEINFDEAATRRILTEDVMSYIGACGAFFGVKRSIVVRPTQASLRLKELALHLLAALDRDTGIIFDDEQSSAEQSSLGIPSGLAGASRFNEDTLIEMSGNLFSELLDAPRVGGRIAGLARRDLALRIEQFLWEPPFSRHADNDVSLDELAQRFGASKRTIQISLQEQFGLGFVSLRKLIRLHQLRRVIRLKRDNEKIGVLGAQFYLSHFGRLSKEYKDMFGVLPSVDLKR